MGARQYYKAENWNCLINLKTLELWKVEGADDSLCPV